jgi:putative DNA methylase
MSIERRFDVAFVANLALREKQIQQNYRPVIAVHKWFARRPGTLFRALLLAEFGEGPLQQNFYRANDHRGKRIADPFMGGGTPLLEANRIGSPRCAPGLHGDAALPRRDGCLDPH